MYCVKYEEAARRRSAKRVLKNFAKFTEKHGIAVSSQRDPDTGTFLSIM